MSAKVRAAVGERVAYPPPLGGRPPCRTFGSILGRASVCASYKSSF
jgi:hypothetical protein